MFTEREGVDVHFYLIGSLTCAGPVLRCFLQPCEAGTDISQPLYRALQGQGDARKINGPDFPDTSGIEALEISSKN